MRVKTYQNNLRMAVNTKKDVDVVSFKIFVTAGAKDEKTSEYGYAHFLEHMFFKSTKRHTGEEILKKLDDLGASKNAYTSVSKTCYYFKSISSVFEECLKMYSEMFFNQTFSKEEIEKEKLVILEEYKMGEDNPTKKCIQSAYNRLFAGTPLGHNVIGTENSIKSVTAGKLLNFKNRTYLPNNIVISISGNISFKQADKLINKYFIRNFKNEEVMEIYKPLKYLKLSVDNKYVAKKKDNKQVEVYIMIDLKERTRQERIAFNLLFAILGYGMSSRFFEVIRGREGLVYNIDAGCSKICNNFVAEIIFATSPENVAKALISIKKIIKLCSSGDISEEELARTKNQFISGLIFSSESNSVIAENNALDLIEYGKIYGEKQVSREYMDISLEDVTNCAKQIDCEENFVISAVGPVLKKDLKIFI